MAVVFNAVTRINSLLDLDDVIVAEPLISALFSMLRAVGLETRDDADEVPSDVIERAADRDRARAARDWATADAIRDELVAAGWVVEDTADGTRVRPS
jgi:cysteinyl-tRNA synthetase